MQEPDIQEVPWVAYAVPGGSYLSLRGKGLELMEILYVCMYSKIKIKQANLGRGDSFQGYVIVWVSF